MRKSFTLTYWRDEEWYVGRFEEIPGVFSQGETLEELEENIRDAYGLVLSEHGAGVDTARGRTQGDRGRSVKRRAFLRELRRAGCYLKRHGSRHDLYTNPGQRTGGPRPSPW